MLLVPTYLDKSPIAGIGLFAATDIPTDTHIWTYIDGFDVMFSKAAIHRLPAQVLEFLKIYGHYEDVNSGEVCLCTDNARFMNHSDDPNTRDAHAGTFASRMIVKGEEITANYDDFSVHGDDWLLII